MTAAGIIQIGRGAGEGATAAIAPVAGIAAWTMAAQVIGAGESLVTIPAMLAGVRVLRAKTARAALVRAI